MTITARDGDGSGVALTEVHFGDGNWQPYAAPINLGTDGRYELHVRSSDVAGNDEAEQVVEHRDRPDRADEHRAAHLRRAARRRRAPRAR